MYNPVSKETVLNQVGLTGLKPTVLSTSERAFISGGNSGNVFIQSTDNIGANNVFLYQEYKKLLTVTEAANPVQVQDYCIQMIIYYI